MEIGLMSARECSVSMPVLYLSSWWAQSLYILCSIFFTSGTCATWLTVLQLRILQWGEEPTWTEHSWVFREAGLQLDLAFPDHSMLNFHLSHPCCWGLSHKKKQLRPVLKGRGSSSPGGEAAGLHPFLVLMRHWLPVRDLGAPCEGFPTQILCFFVFKSWVFFGYGGFFIIPNQLGKYQLEQVFFFLGGEV